MIAEVIEIIYQLADIVYNSCVCLYQLAFTDIGVLMQPEAYGATYLTSTGPFAGLYWNIPLVTETNFIGDAFAGILQLMGLPANTPLIGSLLYIAIAGLLIWVLVKLTLELFGALT